MAIDARNRKSSNCRANKFYPSRHNHGKHIDPIWGVVENKLKLVPHWQANRVPHRSKIAARPPGWGDQCDVSTVIELPFVRMRTRPSASVLSTEIPRSDR